MRITALLFISALLALSGCAAGKPLATPADHPASPQAVAAPTAGHSPYDYRLPPDPPDLTAPQPMGHGGMSPGMDMKPAQSYDQGTSMPATPGHDKGMSLD